MSNELRTKQCLGNSCC